MFGIWNCIVLRRLGGKSVPKKWNTHFDSDSKCVEFYQAITYIIIINTALGMSSCFGEIRKNITKDGTESIEGTREKELNEKEWKLYIFYRFTLESEYKSEKCNTQRV